MAVKSITGGFTLLSSKRAFSCISAVHYQSFNRLPRLLVYQRIHYSAGAVNQDGEIHVRYEHGLATLSVPLPSRKERCQFSLRPATSTLSDLVGQLQHEDKGTDHVRVYTLDGERIAKSTPMDVVLRQDFNVVINDRRYFAKAPNTVMKSTSEPARDVSALKNAIAQLYSGLNVEQHQLEHEHKLVTQRDQLCTELESLEKIKMEIETKSKQTTNRLTWVALGLMGIQFGFLARLTWFEYSWDIMEPLTYFVGHGTTMVIFAYYLATRQEYILTDVHDRQFLFTFHGHANKQKFDVIRYNELREQLAQTEYNLTRLRDPLQLHLPPRPVEKPEVKYDGKDMAAA